MLVNCTGSAVRLCEFRSCLCNLRDSVPLFSPLSLVIQFHLRTKCLKSTLQVLALSVCTWGLLHPVLSAVRRIKQNKTYKTYKAKIMKHHMTPAMPQASTSHSLPPSLLPSFMSIEQIMLEPATVLGTEETVKNEQIRSL